MSNPKTRKSCIVPKCTNNTVNSPEKLFFIVPKDLTMRKKWIKAINRLDPFGDKSTVYCCEDHFDIENDMDNYIKFKLVGGQLKLKKGTIPHKFKCQEKGDKTQKCNQIKYFKRPFRKIPFTKKSTTEKPKVFEEIDPLRRPMKDSQSSSCNLQVTVSVEKVFIKEEPVWDRGVSEEATAVGLYENHEIKQEFVLGPELLQPQDVSYPFEVPLVKGPMEFPKPCVKEELNTDGDEANSDNGVILECDYCTEQFSTLSDLTNHMQDHKRKIYICDYCKKEFLHRRSLYRHILLHNEKRPFSCKFCDKRFPKQTNLTEHLGIHIGEKPYACQYCKKQFVCSTDLSYHIQVHTKEKLYACEHCQKRFTCSSHLLRHLRFHTGEKPYYCDNSKSIFMLREFKASLENSHSREAISVWVLPKTVS